MRPRLRLRSAQALALLAAFWAQAALAHVEHGAGWWTADGFVASALGPGPCARDGGRRPVGCATGPAGDLGAAAGVSAGHGAGRDARVSGAAAAGGRSRHCRIGHRAGHRRRLRAAPEAGHRGAGGGVLRHLPRACPWHRTAPRPERVALQPGLRDRDRLPACAGHSIGTVHSRPWGRQMLRVAGAAVAAGGVFFMVRALA